MEWLFIALPHLFLATVVFGPFPIVGRGGKKSTNNGLFSNIQHDADIEAKGQSPYGVAVQEIGESRLSFAIVWPFLPLAQYLLSGYAVPGWEAQQLIYTTGPLLLMFLVWFPLRVLTQGLDLLGHGAEILIAERENRENYREEEISRMLWSRKGQTAEQVAKNLKKWEWASRIMVKLVEKGVTSIGYRAKPRAE